MPSTTTATPGNAAAAAAEPEDTHGIDPAIYHRRWAILAILCISLVTIVVAVSSLNVALPTIIEALRPTSTQQLWIIDAYALVFAVTLLPAGAIGDRFGRKWALLVGLVIFGVMAVVASQAGSAGQLIAARAVMGIGAALIMPATLSIITNVFPPHERQRAIATWAGLAGAGGALGPLMSGLVLKTDWWWGAVFIVNIPLVLLLIGLVTFFVPNSKDPAGHALDPLGALISVLMLGALVLGIIEGPHWGWTSSGVLGAFAVAIVGGLAFVGWEMRAPHPMLDPRLFRLKGFAMGSLSITLAFFCMFGTFLLLSFYLQFVHGYTPLGAAVRTLPSAIVMILVSPRSPKIVEAIGVKNTQRVGFGLIATGFVGMSFLHVDTPYWYLVIFLCLMSSGMATLMAPASGMIVSSLPLSKAGVGSAVNDVTREVGGAIGIAIMGSLLSSGYRSEMATRTAKFPIPDAIRPVVEDSIGAAMHVASDPRTPREGAAALRDAARHSFIVGNQMAFWVAAGVAVVAALIVSRNIPNEAPVPGSAPEQLPGLQPDPA